MNRTDVYKTVECECCGRTILNDSDHNAWYGLKDKPSDGNGGMCVECVDWANHLVFDHPIEVVMDGLSELNQQKFSALPFSKKCWIVYRLVEKGALSWKIG